MIPLLSKPQSLSNKPSSYCGKTLCIPIVIIFIITISVVSYFNFGSTSLHNNNPAKSLYKHPLEDTDTNDIIPSDPSKASEYYKSSGPDDEILTMPNLLESTCSESATNCAFKQYSGYLLGNNNAEIHYWFITADTEDAMDKPVFFWTNGGPGCSGMDGLLTEHGPWRVDDNLDIVYNPYSWNKEINIVYIEQPYGVGFSAVADNDEVVAGDQNAANDIDAIIRNFITKFPEYQDNKIYLSSESWGGHYVPMSTYTILQNNDAGATPYINFGGFLLGNPYTDWYENTYGFVGDIYGHGLLVGEDWDKWRENCWDNEYNIDYDALCSAIYTRAYIASWNANVYALDWPQCQYDMDWNAKSMNNRHRWRYQQDAHLHEHAQVFMKRVIDHENYEELQMRMDKDELIAIYDQLRDKQLHNQYVSKVSASTTYSIMTDSYIPCLEYNMADWLNLPEVQSALNVKPTPWEMCSDPVWNAWPESDYDAFIETYYTEIIENYVVDKGLKLCVYSGDDDSVCGLQGTQYWLDRWDGFIPNQDIQWTPWEDTNGQLGGYYTQYMMENDNDNVGLHFYTVRTAGHMVPTTEPQRALDLLRRYLEV